MINLDVRFLPYSEIVKIAEDFLRENKVNTIPVPIDDIIDINYGIDIIPTPGLLKLYETDGFITPDFSSIYVDDFVYEQRYFRYRFTLAHEIGHLKMHKCYLEQFPINSMNGWKQFIEEIDPDDHSKMEYQGYAFGGLVLVPRKELEIQFNKFLPDVMPLIDKAKRNGVSRENYLDYAKDKLTSMLAPIFQASTDTITRRIDYDSLMTKVP